MYEISDVEDTIITAMDPLRATLGVKTIKSYEGELSSEEEIIKASPIFPAIFVVYGGSEYEDYGYRKTERMTFVVFVCDRSLRPGDEARRGGKTNPGVYAMLDGIRDLLFGNRFGTDLFPFSLGRQTPEYSGRGISIYSAEYKTTQALLYQGD